MDLNILRKALEARKREWSALAAEANVSRKTIERICLHGHEPNWSTVRSLWRAVFETSEKQVA